MCIPFKVEPEISQDLSGWQEGTAHANEDLHVSEVAN